MPCSLKQKRPTLFLRETLSFSAQKTNGGRSVKQKLVSDIRQLVCSIWSRVVIPRTVLKNGEPSKAELRVNQVQHALSGKATIQTTNSFYSHYFVLLKRFFLHQSCLHMPYYYVTACVYILCFLCPDPTFIGTRPCIRELCSQECARNAKRGNVNGDTFRFKKCLH